MKHSRWRALLRKPETSSFLILCLAVVFFTVANDRFLSPLNVSNLLAFLPELGIIALGMTLLLTAGEFDLSVGAVFAFCPVISMLLVQHAGIDLGTALIVGFALTATIGAANGLFVTKAGISSFLVTLSMLLLVRGCTLFATQGFPLASWSGESILQILLAGSFYVGEVRLHASIIWFAALAALMFYVLNYSKVGNWISAIGSNRSAAVARGVPADAVKIGLFIVTSLLAGLAGIISSLRISSASPVAGDQYELEVIAMVVVGGTALTGGRGTIIGTIIGVFLLRIIRNGIVLVGVPGLAFNIFVGGIILIMLMVHSIVHKRSIRS
ncbi:ABC transporter permease [Chelativorans xinjiangense]|uniref:ABC transporter permease n=1 Tax=Chelativorans xinjiangense TaxID=2681485 RepID=UPI00135882C0|nr:ABC transporter permease [Chelativorans xinjiangense]